MVSTIWRGIGAALLAAGAASAANAAVTLRISGNNDSAFEGAGGALQTVYGLTTISGGTYLPPLERAVGQLKQASQDRRGLFMPTNASGRPVADGGTGVTAALTNFTAYAVATTDYANGVAESFKVERIGNLVRFTFGNNILTSDSRLSLGNVNAFQFRIRSNATTLAAPANSIAFTNLLFSDAITSNQAIGDFSAANGAVNIGLWDGIVGDFALIGNFTVSWTGTRPGGSALAAQVKLLEVPVLTSAIPEPASWAMLIAGFGLTGATLRRRRALA